MTEEHKVYCYLDDGDDFSDGFWFSSCPRVGDLIFVEYDKVLNDVENRYIAETKDRAKKFNATEWEVTKVHHEVRWGYEDAPTIRVRVKRIGGAS